MIEPVRCTLVVHVVPQNCGLMLSIFIWLSGNAMPIRATRPHFVSDIEELLVFMRAFAFAFGCQFGV